MIPLLHDFTGTNVLVFGGGRVGARKARRFAREADVTVVSPTFTDADFGGAERVSAVPSADDVSTWFDRVDPALVVAATDDAELNERIERQARDRNVLVNRTDTHGDRDHGSVVVPATVREDPVVVAIATGGTSPALSKHLRQRLEAELAGVGEMATLTADLRERLQEDGVPSEIRHEAVSGVVNSSRVWKTLDSGDTNVRQVAAEVVEEVTGDSE
ncbi:bifunctional precorrin-2 dehydrogenase/sirohydrochlorin ferrochelatase [Haloarculaceae archaeon H-GB11]|nr:bifunctional precorrin-2 dehydrogenase/sirohydrochlorin ferrochelatase [Haloarculaceae archaeon H-GB11]